MSLFSGRIFLAPAALVSGLFLAATVLAEPITPNETPAAVPAETEQTELKDAATAFEDRDFAGALGLLQEAVRKYPQLPPARVIMAQWFLKTNQLVLARMSLERAVADSPNDPEAYVWLGKIAMSESRITEADLLYSKAASLVPGLTASAERKKNVQIQTNDGLAAVAELRGDWPKVQKHLEDWLKLDSSEAIAMQRLARALFQQKKVKESLAQLKAAAAIDKNILFPGARFALFYEQSGDHEAAKTWMDYAVKKAPNDSRVQLVAANWALETGQLPLAQKLADAALKIEPDSLRAMLLRGMVASFQKDYKTAEFYFQKAHTKSPLDFQASNNLALALVEQDDQAKRAKALQYAEGNAREYPNVPDAASTYGWVLYKLGRVDEAERVLKHLAAGGNFGPNAAYYMACVWAHKGKKEVAKKLLESALANKGIFANRKEAETLLKKLGQ